MSTVRSGLLLIWRIQFKQVLTETSSVPGVKAQTIQLVTLTDGVLKFMQGLLCNLKKLTANFSSLYATYRFEAH